MHRQVLPAVCLMVLTAGPPAARPAMAGEGTPRVTVDVVALKETVVRDAAGKEKVELTPALRTGPGDTLVYRISCTNRGDAPARDASVVDAIPAGTRLVPDSWEAAGAEFSVSVDGGRTWSGYPVTTRVTRADGTTADRPVDDAAYTHVRWIAKEPLAPGATRSAVFKVTVR